MNATQPTCAELIHQRLSEREEDLRVLFSNPDSDEYFDDPALGLESYTLTRITFSTGGPADFLDIAHKDGQIRNVEYHYQDWYDGARVSVPENSPLYDYALNIVQGME